MCYIPPHSSRVRDTAVRKCETAVWSKGVGDAGVIADADGYGSVAVGHVGRDVGGLGRESGECGVCLIRDGGDGPAGPIDGAVAQGGDLRGEGGIDMQD